MSNLISLILTVLYLTFFGLSSFLFFFIAVLIKILTFPFDKKLIVLNLFTSFWASCYLWCVPTWSIKKYGREKFSLKKNYIVVSNHQSQMDILLAFNLFFPCNFCTVLWKYVHCPLHKNRENIDFHSFSKNKCTWFKGF